MKYDLGKAQQFDQMLNMISYLPPRRLLAIFALLPILLLPPRVGRFTNIDTFTWMISP